VGLSQDKKTLILMVVDGRSSASVGMTCTEVAAQMKSFGAYDAINLDGGGSTTMYLRGTGVVNTPSDGAERTVGNHLGIFAPRLGSVGSVHGTVFADPDPKKPITGATVTIAGGGTDTTDATGLYDLDTVPGMFAVTAKKPGFTTKSVNVTVGTGGDVKLDVGLVADPNADFDGDSVVDSKDNCAEVKNPDQLDIDKDGIGDACDMDDDGDNVADEDDNCPSVSNVDQADSDDNGVGDACPPASPAADGGAPPIGAAPPPADSDSDKGCSVSHVRGGGSALALDVGAIGLVALALGTRRRRRR
jgi:MYXO-CTERM domain-containing protein